MAGNIALVQCLCPRRHCILGLAFDIRGTRPDEAVNAMRGIVEDMAARKILYPSCGLCRAPVGEWFYEVGLTRFDSMKEAEAPLRAAEEAQARSAAWLKDQNKN